MTCHTIGITESVLLLRHEMRTPNLDFAIITEPTFSNEKGLVSK